MTLRIKELPSNERPYEKMKAFGEEVLSNAELLAIIIKTGTKEENSLQIANRVLSMISSFSDIYNLSIEDLKKIKGIGEVKAIQIKALCEIAKRISSSFDISKYKIKSYKDVVNLLMDEMKFQKQEIVKVILLNTKNYIVKIKDIVKGEPNYASVTPKAIFTEAIKMQVGKLIVVHNHPSGDPTPSMADINFTNKLIEIGEILGIEVLDHIILGNNKYKSIISRGE